ncbi:MAG: hypothetical protein R2794_06730 [Chitinophagales bacterium]
MGEDAEMIYDAYAYDAPDTAKMRKQVIRLQNKLFNDTTRFCNVYLDTIFKPHFKQWSYYQDDTGSFAREMKDLVSAFSDNGQSVIDSLNGMQSRLEPSDFKLCTARILSVRDLESQKGKCGIGVVSFSKVFLDSTKSKGLLYCNFRCGGLCGFGHILIIERVKDRWTITKTIETWIS